jgi:hypothetical protein
MGNKGDIVTNAPYFGAFAVDQIDLELSHFLDGPSSIGGQSVDRQA